MFALQRAALAAIALLVAASACGPRIVPSGSSGFAAARSARVADARPADTNSILKRLTKNVEIGSTIDARNGDKAPRSLSIVPCDCSGNLTKGQLVVCNFDNKAGAAGAGTTIEVLDPSAKSKPVRFAQSSAFKGCNAAALTSINEVYAVGLTSGRIVEITNKGQVVGSRKPMAAPFSDADALPKQFFSPEYIFAGSTSGGILSLSIGFHGNGQGTQVAEGFAVSKGSKGDLAPSGLQYDRAIDTLYVVDGASDTIVAFAPASELLRKDEIVVGKNGKTFKCRFAKTVCAKLVKAGAPLEAPVASTLLPNGNFIVANTHGTANKLVELTPQGQVLATKVVDKSKTQGVFGLAAAGSNDNDTVLYFTDTNTDSVQELEPGTQ